MLLSSSLQATTFSATWPTICPTMTVTLRRLERGAPECSIGKAVVRWQLSTASSVASICPSWSHLLSGLNCHRRIAGKLVTSLPRTAVRVVAPAADGRQSLKGPETSFGGKKAVEETVLGASPPGVSGLSKESSKECKECHRMKLLRDFENRVTGVDGRTEWCRACLATFRAKRSQREPPHLKLSVEEAWKRGKKCSMCGSFKECRDFPRDSSRNDGLHKKCRACTSEVQNRRPVKQPIDIAQKCGECNKVKAAAEFYRQRKGSLGLQDRCKECQRQFEIKRRPLMRTSPKLATEEKRCRVCHIVKKVADFSPNHLNIDGLTYSCKDCLAVAKRLKQGTVPLWKGTQRGSSGRGRKYGEGDGSLRKGLDENLDDTEGVSWFK